MEEVIRSNRGEIKIPRGQKRKGKKFEDKMNENFQNSKKKNQNRAFKTSYK